MTDLDILIACDDNLRMEYPLEADSTLATWPHDETYSDWHMEFPDSILRKIRSAIRSITGQVGTHDPGKPA